MKRFGFFIAAFSAALLLTGCSGEPQTAECDHQWVQADCLTPKTCCICQETEGKAMGHDWTEADCVNPKTCRVCQESEGEAAGHDWTEVTCTSLRTCQGCGIAEGTYLPHTMENWTVQGDQMSRSCRYCRELETVPYDQDRFLTDHVAGTWDQHFTEIYYSGHLGYNLNTYRDYTVSLLEDKTFTAYLGNEISGIWSFKQVPNANGQGSYRCDLKYNDSGTSVSASGREGSYDNHLEFVVDADTAHIVDHTSPMKFHYFRQKVDTDWDEETELLTGHWTSLSVVDIVPGKKANQQITTEHSITFHADGTLEASFGGEKTGRWVFDKRFCPEQYTMDSLFYVLHFDGEEEGLHADIQMNTQLCISESEVAHRRNYWFAKITPEEAEFFGRVGEMVPGTWRATSALRENPETGLMDLETDPKGFALTFQEGGNLTVSGDKEARGTWQQNGSAYVENRQYGNGYIEFRKCRIILNYNGSYQYCTLTPEGKMEITLDFGEGFVYLILEKE